eukprot:TRINITY_DN10_c0_g2_i1.p1 TRINITY_DN10_c0_g2~~TRINITY_DN10_c0_g2_i1.p1  ORF type:complete len:184 (-),score=41.97 TRINITY_DN10_c0_g2_i1:77-628(-)
MKVTLFTVFAVLIALAICQTKPHISDNFAAVVTVSENARDTFEAHTWEDFDLKRTRVDVHREGGGPGITFYRFFDQQKEYRVDHDEQQCTQRTLNTTLQPAFGWTSNSTMSKYPCHSNIRVGHVGVEWDSANPDAHLCADSTGSTPYWVERPFENGRLYFLFHTFLPGKPSASVWTLPTFCNQ